MKTNQSLGVYWKLVDGFEYIDGMYFYGFWLNELPPKQNMENINFVFSSGKTKVKLTRFDGEDYKVYEARIAIEKYPDKEIWFKTIRDTLHLFIDQGAIIAWCGGEDCSPNPTIFDSKTNGGNIYSSLFIDL